MASRLRITARLLLALAAMAACTRERAAPQPPPDAAPSDAAPSGIAPRDATPPPRADVTPLVPTVGRYAGPLGDKPIMTPCAEHCECQTGYCYDEGYPGSGGRFCSMDCNAPSIGDCAAIRHATRPHLQKYGCLQLNALARAHDLKTTRICVLRCENAAECTRYSSRYDRCGNYSGGRMTMWAGHTLAAFGTCLDSSAISPDTP